MCYVNFCPNVTLKQPLKSKLNLKILIVYSMLILANANTHSHTHALTHTHTHTHTHTVYSAVLIRELYIIIIGLFNMR